jgi:polyhydroxyalkanoate synthesis regulator phasin
MKLRPGHGLRPKGADMASQDPWKHYLEAGLEFTELTRKRAEKVVRDLVKAGEVQRHEAQERIEELLERSRKTTESFGEAVRKEVTRQMQALGLVQPVKQAAEKTTATAKKTAGAAKKSAQKTTSKAASKAASTAKKAAGKS